MILARDALGQEAPPPPRSAPRARLHLALPRDKAETPALPRRRLRVCVLAAPSAPRPGYPGDLRGAGVGV